jgi:hypothetical protein
MGSTLAEANSDGSPFQIVGPVTHEDMNARAERVLPDKIDERLRGLFDHWGKVNAFVRNPTETS